MNQEVLLEVQNLGKQYTKNVWGLQHASFKLRRGNLTALLGANGAGKSTLIHLLAGVLKNSEGKIDYIGIKKTDIGWVSQHPVIDWFMNVQDNVRLGARLAGCSRNLATERALNALKIVGLENKVDAQPDQLSGGQQQRLQIARALTTEPSLLLLDEPTTGLDAHFSEELLKVLQSRAQEGSSVLIASHDLGLVERHCENIIFIHQGECIYQGAMRDFLTKYSSDTLGENGEEGLREIYLRMVTHEKGAIT